MEFFSLVSSIIQTKIFSASLKKLLYVSNRYQKKKLKSAMLQKDVIYKNLYTLSKLYDI